MTDTTDTTDTTEPKKPKKPQGFATFSPEKRRELSSKGGKRCHELGLAHQFTKEEAAIAGKKGGLAPHKRRGRVPRQVPIKEEP
jgi:hypothetical protein